MLLHESQRPVLTLYINTTHSHSTPMRVLDKTKTTTMIALLLPALVAHCFAVPLPSDSTDNWLQAEVRQLCRFTLNKIHHSMKNAYLSIYISLMNRSICDASMAFQLDSMEDEAWRMSFRAKSGRCRNFSNSK